MTRRTVHPTAHHDQLQAAAAHARRVVARAATEHGNLAPVHHPPAGGWLAGQLRELLTQLRDRTARACPHLHDAAQLIHAAAWAPARLVCTACLHTLDPDPIENTRCDRCHQPADTLRGNVAAIGPLLYTYALCPPCTSPAVTGGLGNGPGNGTTPR